MQLSSEQHDVSRIYKPVVVENPIAEIKKSKENKYGEVDSRCGTI